MMVFAFRNHSRKEVSVRFLLIAVMCLASGVGWFPDGVPSVHAGGPENLLLVVNVNSQDSLAIANHYVRLRNIPSQNVVYLDEVPNAFACTQDEFRDKILLPLIAHMQQHGIGGQIDTITYSAGFPTGVKIESHVKLLSERVENLERRAWNPRASINALTFFLREFLADNPSYLTMDSNWYVRRNVRNMLEVPFMGELQEEYSRAIAEYKQGPAGNASRSFANIIKDHPGQVAARYYLARALASEGKPDEALRELVLCVRSGWCYPSLTRNDPAFADLRDRPRFQEIVEACPDEVYAQLPTRGFSGDVFWARNGWDNGDQNQGKQLVLSTVLGVTFGRGNSLDQVLEYLQRSAAVDGTRPGGTFFFSQTTDIRSKTRQVQFPIAIKELKELGFRAEIVKGDLPLNRQKVLGVTTGRANLDWRSSRSLLDPGAIFDNLTSFGGMMRDEDTQTPCTHFLANGASGASGTVAEPLAIANKFPGARLHVHYARGCNLAEAYYQSVQSPFQLLIVGDPLCAPGPGFPSSKFADWKTVKR